MSETTSRALSLLNLLQTHRHWSGVELADRLGVTSRTLRRDIERLRDLGYRIESLPGVAGGYRLEAGAALPPLLLTDDEAVTMAIGLRLAATQALTDGGDTTLTALAKLEQVLPPALRRRVNALAATVQPMRRDRPAVDAELLASLALACRDTERIRFHYTAAGGVESDRLVEPYSLVPADRHWFLLCWDLQREDWRTFRVDRLSRLVSTRARFTPRELPDEDAAEYVRVAVASVPSPLVGDAIIDRPFAEMHEYFGAWSRGATPVGDDRTRWPIGGRMVADIVGALAYIPEGWRYEIEADPEVVAAIGEAAARMASAARVKP
ncbi:MAG TPA: WYL domain-containing protein [Solirubrobacteraceae bacterium]|nr:WYL domain-containing protein [Solirubrobacteraceae bacterium]